MTALNDVRMDRAAGGGRPAGGSARVSLLPRQGLLRAVEDAVRETDATALKAVAHPLAGLALQPRALLALLAFSYARQVYASTSIAANLKSDLARHHFSCEQLPDAQVLRRFRAENRAPLERCLSKVLRHMADEKVLEGRVTHVSEGQLARESARRIVMAMFTDTAESDSNPAGDVSDEASFIVANE